MLGDLRILNAGDELLPDTERVSLQALFDLSFTKGCYVAQETVAGLHWRGKPNRHLRGLRLSARRHRHAAAPEREGRRRVRSAAASPTHGPIAVALVRREAQPGAVPAAGDDGATAEVVELPF